MRYTLAVTAAAALSLVSGVGAQEGPVLLSIDASLTDYGIQNVDEVLRGRVSLVHDPAGDRLAVHFLRSQAASLTPVPVEPAPPPELEGGDRTPEMRAIWVWNTSEILADATEREGFLDFVATQAIERVFLYVPVAEPDEPSAGYLPFDGEALAPLLRQLYERGARAYALDGDPDYVRPENHAGVLRTVRRVADHNRSHPPEERFYGVRYDIEPYLLGGFQGPARQEILDNYVWLLASIADVARQSGLRVGADIPFWFDAGDEDSGMPFEAWLEGERRPVLDHVMRTVDDVAIMAYRTTADGPNGVIGHAAREVELGNRERANVFVGVETTRIYDEALYTLRGSPRAGLPPLPDARWIVLEELGETRVRIWLVEGAEAIAELAGRTEVDSLRSWFAGQPVPLPGDLLSFHSLGAAAMWSVTTEIEERYRHQPGYLGLAFHDYRGLRALLEPTTDRPGP